MSYHNDRFNKPKRAPKPRNVITDPGHALDPVVEAAIACRQELQDHKQFGDVLSTDSVTVEAPGVRATMMVSKMALAAQMQFGVPHDHASYPMVRKFATCYKEIACAAVYSSMIPWQKDAKFVHIPCFTRYVMSQQGIVLNAVDGTQIKPDNWGNYRLVQDGFSNTLRGVPLMLLKMLALAPLPEGFTDYGYGTYSHVLDFDQGVVKWVPRLRVRVKKLSDGQTAEYASLSEYAICEVKDFKVRNEMTRVKDDEILQQGSVMVDEFQIMPVEPVEYYIPVVGVAQQPVVATQPAMDPLSPIPQQPAPMQQPMQQTVPVQQSVQQPAVPEFDPNQMLGQSFQF